MTNPAQTGPERSSTARVRLMRRVAVVIVLSGLVFLFRGTLLGGLARPLVRLEPEIAADAVLLLGDDNALELGAHLLREKKAERVFVATGAPSQFMIDGILPDDFALNRTRLEAHGVPSGQIEELRVRGVDGTLTDALARWLNDHPDSRCLVLCDELRTREVRWRLDRTLPVADRTRIALRAVPHRRYCRSDWWKSEAGISAFVGGWLSLILQATRGDVTQEWRECQPTQFTMNR